MPRNLINGNRLRTFHEGCAALRIAKNQQFGGAEGFADFGSPRSMVNAGEDVQTTLFHQLLPISRQYGIYAACTRLDASAPWISHSASVVETICLTIGCFSKIDKGLTT